MIALGVGVLDEGRRKFNTNELKNKRASTHILVFEN